VEVKKVLLDTNAYSALMNGSENVLAALGGADTVYLSIFVIGELLTGFYGGKRGEENRKMFERFKAGSTVKILHGTEDTSEIFASVKHALANAGTPIPINDIWIASHTLETGAVLLTNDRHFEKVPGLRICDFMGDQVLKRR
jgi:tRNA(fMet)-specific endonuclease VapC